MRYKHTLKLRHIDSSSPQDMGVEESDAQMNHSLLYVASGNVDLLEQDQNRTIRHLKKGSLALLSSGSQQPLENETTYETWRLNFCPGCLFLSNNSSLTRYFLQARNGALPIVQLSRAQRPYIESLFEKLKYQVDNIDDSDIDIVRSLVILILAEVNQASLAHQKTITPSKVIEALGYIAQHYHEPISLKDVAQAIHSSPAHLATLVKKHTDFSIGHWILQHRMTDACTRLTHNQDSIDTIAAQTGWGDSTHFIRQFKKYKGLTPHQWKKAMLQQIENTADSAAD